MNATVAATAPSYGFTADVGVRVAGGVQPVELVVGQTIHMYLGGYTEANGKVLPSSDGLTFAPVAAPLDGVSLMAGTSFSFVTLPNGNFRMHYFSGSGGSPPDTLLSASSSDGLTWTSDVGRELCSMTLLCRKSSR